MLKNDVTNLNNNVCNCHQSYTVRLKKNLKQLLTSSISELYTPGKYPEQHTKY